MRSHNEIVPQKEEVEGVLEVKTPRGTVRRYRVTLSEGWTDEMNRDVYVKITQMDFVHYEEVVS